MSRKDRSTRLLAAWSMILPAGLSAGALSCRPEPAATAGGNYNVVLISVDTLRADRLNCYGYRDRVVSPHIDALAGDGILFENHVTASPWTTPAHLSMLTSLYPSTHGVTASFGDLTRDLLRFRNYYKLPDARTTLAEVLKAHGFATAAFTAGSTVDPKIGFGQGFSTYDTSMYKLNDDNMGAMYAWIKRHADRRFFLFWHNFEVHAPYLHTDFLSEVLGGESADAVRAGIAQVAAVLTGQNPGEPVRLGYNGQLVKLLERHDAFTPDVCDALYVGGVRSMDRWLGRFVQFLRDNDLYDRTLIILTSDHGEELGERMPKMLWDMHGHTLYEELLRVPLIIKLPHQRYAGTRVKSVARIVDIMPTILDLLSIAPANDEMQGASLRAFWEEKGSSGPPRVAYSEALSGRFEMKSLRTDRYKYVIHISEATVEAHGRNYVPHRPIGRALYDLWEDPSESRNLLATRDSKLYDDLAARFDRSLRDFAAAQHGVAERVRLDQETIDRLKALGYIK